MMPASAAIPRGMLLSIMEKKGGQWVFAPEAKRSTCALPIFMFESPPMGATSTLPQACDMGGSERQNINTASQRAGHLMGEVNRSLVVLSILNRTY